MDELDRLFGLLIAALAKETRVAVPFPAAEIYERLVPYRSNRARLNVATHQDYEMTVLRLLSGERNYVQLEPDNVREAMQSEIATVNPDPAYFRSFPDAQVMVNGHAAEQQERSNGLIPSGFDTWLAQQRARGKFVDFDPDKELHERSK